MVSRYLTFIQQRQTMIKNFSRSIMAGIANLTRFDQATPSQRKQLIIFPLFFLVATLFLSVSGCAGQSTSLTPDSLTATSQPNEKRSLRVPGGKPSTDSQPVYIYKTDKRQLNAAPSVTSQSHGTTTVSQSRLIQLNTEIDERTLDAASKLYTLAEINSTPIDVVIDSPGGYISHGLYFIKAMKALQAKGIVIRCHVPRFAASMAYTIFTQCSERYTLPFAQLLFHPPRIGGQFLLTPMSAVGLAKGLINIEKVLLDLIIPAMGVSQEVGGQWFVDNYLGERLFIAEDLLAESPTPWFKIVGRMKWVD